MLPHHFLYVRMVGVVHIGLKVCLDCFTFPAFPLQKGSIDDQIIELVHAKSTQRTLISRRRKIYISPCFVVAFIIIPFTWLVRVLSIMCARENILTKSCQESMSCTVAPRQELPTTEETVRKQNSSNRRQIRRSCVLHSIHIFLSVCLAIFKFQIQHGIYSI